MYVYTKWDGSSAATYLQVEMLRIYRQKSLLHIGTVNKSQIKFIPNGMVVQ